MYFLFTIKKKEEAVHTLFEPSKKKKKLSRHMGLFEINVLGFLVIGPIMLDYSNPYI
jgi:hypothetical protein